VARVSESLRCREDQGELPAELGRSDIETFLNRLGYLESAGTISRYHRNGVCRGARVPHRIGALGLTRPGQAAAGLPGDFAVGLRDILAEPLRGEPGRDLPPEIMAVLCASLDTLEPPAIRAAIQIAIDTGRRREDILDLPLDCLQRDKDGAAVLVYETMTAPKPGGHICRGIAAVSCQMREHRRLPVAILTEPGAAGGHAGGRLVPASAGSPPGFCGTLGPGNR